MKKQLLLPFFVIFTLVGITISCQSPQPKPNKNLIFRTGIPGHTNSNFFQNLEPIGGVKIKYFNSLINWLNNANAIDSGVTDINGFLPFSTFIESGDTLFIKAEKGGLSNLRFKDIKAYAPLPTQKSSTQISQYFGLRLSDTPTQMGIQIRDGLTPMQNYTIQLFLSQEDYDKDQPADEQISLSTLNYGNWQDASISNKNDYFYPIFNQQTNEIGMAYFHSLQPRAYWFKVYDESQNEVAVLPNSTSTPLPDDPNLTSIFTLQIQSL